MYCEEKKGQSQAKRCRCRKIVVAVAELLTSAMILPFWGSSRYLASWLWGGTCQSRVIPVAGHFLEVVLLFFLLWSGPEREMCVCM